MDRVLQDPLEQHRQLARRFVGIFLGQLEHRVLDDVERRFVIPHGIHRLLERTPLDFREEGRNFLCRGQFGISLENCPIIGGLVTCLAVALLVGD